MGLAEEGALYAYLSNRHGEGRYIVEATDPHGMRYDRVPVLRIPEGDENMPRRDDDFDDDDEDDDEYDDRRRGGRPGFRRRRGRAEEDDEDNRANVSDLLLTANKVSHANAAAAGAGAKDMISLMVMSQAQQAQERNEAERRREENAREERRRDEAKAEQRLIEARDERKRQDERDERIRKEERDREIQERREESDRRREDMERRQAEHLRMVEAANKRTELVLGGLATFAPLLAKIFESKPPPPESPMMGIMLKSLVDKSDRKDSSELLMQQMMQMSRMSSEMQAEQLKSMMSTQNQFSNEMIKRAMTMMAETPQGQSEQGQDFLGKVATIMGSATEMVKGFFPAKSAGPALPPPQPMRRMHQPPRPALPAPQQQQPGPINAQVPPQQPAPGAPAPVPEAPAEAQPTKKPEPMVLVLGALQHIHQRKFRNQGEFQNLIRLVIEQMPIDLRVAVIRGEEMRVMQLTLPWIQQSQVFVDWFDFQGEGEGEAAIPGTVAWIRGFVPDLAPHLVAMHGPIEEQERQLAEALAARGLVPKEEANAQPVEVLPQEQAPEPEQPTESAPAQPAEPESVIVPPAPEAVPVPVLVPVESAVPDSHLTDHDVP